jgi:ABC-type antimicrobial peptide transport system permease subunit
MRSALFGVVEFNATLFLGLVLLVTAVALVAAYVPARRAMHADPIGSLRSE